ncbi:MAG: carboxypeptidase-like regulatory domain-containing protein [Pyrinomonadaceae bacterium]
MNYNLKSKALVSLLALLLTLTSAAFNPSAEVAAQKRQVNQKVVADLSAEKSDFPEYNGTFRVEAFYPNDKFDKSNVFVPSVVDPNGFYSNVTTLQGFFLANGGSTLIGANTITRLRADDLTFTRGVPVSITGIRFTVHNNNAGAVSVRARVRFYANNGGVPGNVLAAVSFNAFAFGAGSTTLTSNPFPTFAATTQTLWAGITFDNNSGATGATLAQLDNFGMRVVDPPDRGSSADVSFLTTAAGDFNVSNPTGTVGNTAGAVDNLGWELLSTPNAAQVSIGGRVMTADGQGIGKTTVGFTDSNGAARTAITNGFGYYRFDNVSVGATYVLSASNKRYQFTQPQQVLFIEDEKDDINFIAQ